MFSFRRSAAALLVSALFPVIAAPASEAATAATIAEALKARYPEVKIEKVRALKEWPGLYEIVVQGGQLVYSDANGDHLISGRIIDTRTKADLTTDRWNELHRIDFESLPLNLAIKTVRGDGAKRIAVFADPDCPYCEQLEQVLNDMQGATIYTFLYPLEIHPGARAKAEKIWCAKDRSAAWSDWMLRRVEPTGAACQDDTVSKVLDLGNKLKIDSTPTLFLADGTRINGALSLADLERNIARVQTTK